MSCTPDYAQPIGGWRVWLVADLAGKARLVSVFHHVPWPVRRELVGECLAEPPFRLFRWRPKPEPHAAPEERCACGIYAARELSQAIEYLRSYRVRQTSKVNGCAVVHRVIGRVQLWGTLVECEDGWRGSRAYPERLFVPERTWIGGAVARLEDLALSLADYGIPIEILDGCGLDEEIPEAVREHLRAA